jgi:hypothetical protein
VLLKNDISPDRGFWAVIPAARIAETTWGHSAFSAWRKKQNVPNAGLMR